MFWHLYRTITGAKGILRMNRLIRKANSEKECMFIFRISNNEEIA